MYVWQRNIFLTFLEIFQGFSILRLLNLNHFDMYSTGHDPMLKSKGFNSRTHGAWQLIHYRIRAKAIIAGKVRNISTYYYTYIPNS